VPGAQENESHAYVWDVENSLTRHLCPNGVVKISDIFFLLLLSDDFNRRCLAPEQNEEQMKKLHEEARKIYVTYCCAHSGSFIHFESSIVEELRESKSITWFFRSWF